MSVSSMCPCECNILLLGGETGAQGGIEQEERGSVGRLGEDRRGD